MAALHLITWKAKGYFSSKEITAIVSSHIYIYILASVPALPPSKCYIETDTSDLQRVKIPLKSVVTP